MDHELPVHGDSHASSSHEVSLEPTTKRREDSGKHNVFTHFPKDRICEICAVIKMIIKGRSPTMRQFSRTHRVAIDWLFDRINLDPQIQIKYMDTKNQLADKLTKRNSTRDEWNHLLCFFNISHFSSINKCEAMTKRTQEDAGE